MELDPKIPVLDHGHVIYDGHFGSDADICRAARISYAGRLKATTEADDQKLINYLWKNKHTSPFEMGKVRLVIKMPIFVARQYIRHRMQNVNEVSARYTELPCEFYVPKKWRKQDDKNKQGSVEAIDWEEETREPSINSMLSSKLELHCEESYGLYRELIGYGVAREMARMVLPLNIYTEMVVCWDLKNLLHFITLRENAHAQAEIQEYGKAIKSMLLVLFPLTMSAYERFKFKLEELK